MHTENLYKTQYALRYTQIRYLSCILKLIEYQPFVSCCISTTKNFAHKRLPMTAQEAVFQIMKYTYSRSHSQPFASPNAILHSFMPIFLPSIQHFSALLLSFSSIFPTARKYQTTHFFFRHDTILAKRPCTFL